MDQSELQLQWTEEQWARVRQVIQEEASRARVAGSFLPLYGPLASDTDFVRRDTLTYVTGQAGERMLVEDVDTMPLSTLQINVYLRGPQVADPELRSALLMFRRAANVLARLEDAIIFNGQTGSGVGPPNVGDLPNIWTVLGGEKKRGLYDPGADGIDPVPVEEHEGFYGDSLVGAISTAIGKLESRGHLGPFACVLDQKFFMAVQTPNHNSLVLPQDRIIPFLEGGSLLRSSTLPETSGIVVSLGGSPIDLVIATDITLAFLQVTQDPRFVFRVHEKMSLRLKEADAVIALIPDSQ